MPDFIHAAETILRLIEVALDKTDKLEGDYLKKLLYGFSLIAETIPEGIRSDNFQIHFMWREQLMKLSTTPQIVKRYARQPYFSLSYQFFQSRSWIFQLVTSPRYFPL